MNWLREIYQARSSAEKKQIWILLICSVVGGYGFYASMVWERMFEAEKLANRKADRVEKRIGDITPPKLEDGISQDVLDGFQTKITEQEHVLRAFAKPLLPISDSEAREELKLYINELANSNQLRLNRQDPLDFEQSPLLEQLEGEALRKYFQDRPSFKLELSGQYHNLLRFVDGLEKLQYRTIVERLKVERVSDDNSLLKIEIELNL